MRKFIRLQQELEEMYRKNATLEVKIERLRQQRLFDLRQFCGQKYTPINKPGWLRVDAERQCILRFLKEFEATEVKQMVAAEAAEGD